MNKTKLRRNMGTGNPDLRHYRQKCSTPVCSDQQAHDPIPMSSRIEIYPNTHFLKPMPPNSEELLIEILESPLANNIIPTRLWIPLLVGHGSSTSPQITVILITALFQYYRAVTTSINKNEVE
jgi:hypothetical protein